MVDIEAWPDLADVWGRFGTPFFAITDEKGDSVWPITTARGQDDPAERVHYLISWACDPRNNATGNTGLTAQILIGVAVERMLAEGPIPTNPESIASLVDRLDGIGKTARADLLIEKAISSPKTPKDRVPGMYVVRGLRARVAGKLQQGLADLQKAAGALVLEEGTSGAANGSLAPFAVKSGDTRLGVISSGLDAITVWSALKFAATHPGGPPAAKDVKPEELTSMLAFAEATGNWALAEQTIAAIGNGAGLSQADLPLAACLVLANMARKADAGGLAPVIEEAVRLINTYPEMPYAPDAAAYAIDACTRLGQKADVARLRLAAGRAWGPCIPARLAGRLPKPSPGSVLPGW